MSKVVLSIENLSKQYRLGEIGTGTLSHDLKRWWALARGKEDPYSLVGQVNDRTKKAESDFVWALRDINFELEQGEVLGIIGKNGAGKSTLLKLVSRITSPTSGIIKAKGRVASLLEVGTGMHPEMTARENIYLNGAIMGMTRREISKKFDEIVDFAGCALYVDTPVKRYSSGMRVRLGFAVAAFLEPEILIIDEVLAVGDMEFQKKAIDKIKEVSKTGGRTVLFVSHNMASIQHLCTSCLVLENGSIKIPKSPTHLAVEAYLKGEKDKVADGTFAQRTDREGDQLLQFQSYKVSIDPNQPTQALQSGKPACFQLTYKSNLDAPKQVDVAITISTITGQLVTVMSTAYINRSLIAQPGENKVMIKIPRLPLMEGEFFSNVIVRSGVIIHDWIKEAIFFEVENGDFYGTGKIIENSHKSILFDYLAEQL